jgi:pyruvate kinase
MPADFRRTKIIFTIGPATEGEERLEQIIRAGADVCRLNMAHATHDWTRQIIRRVRTVSQRVGREIAIMMDIKGPEIRTGDLVAPIELKPGEIFDFTVKPSSPHESVEEVRSVDVNYRDLVNDINVGDTVLVDNGLLRLEVLAKDHARIRCKVLIPGTLTSRRHINLPGVKVNLPSFTEKDRADALVGVEEGVDFIPSPLCARPRTSPTFANFCVPAAPACALLPRSRTSRPSPILRRSWRPATRSWSRGAILASSARSRSFRSSSAAP